MRKFFKNTKCFDLKNTGIKLAIVIFVAGIFFMFYFANAQAEDEREREPTILYETKSNAAQGHSTNYYSSRIRDNEIEFLKNKLEEQKADYEQKLQSQKKRYESLLMEQKAAFQKSIEESSYPVVKNLEDKLRKANQNLEEQKKAYEQAIMQKELEMSMRIKELTDKYENTASAQLKDRSKQSMMDAQKIRQLQAKVDSLKEQLKIQKNVQQEVFAAKEKEYKDKIEKLSSQPAGAEREQEFTRESQALLEKDSQIRILTQRLKDLSDKMENQRMVYEKALLEKDKELAFEKEKIKQRYEKSSSQELEEFQDKLTDKYRQLDKIVREKEKTHAQELLAKDQEIKNIKEQAAEQEKMLRQLIAEKELKSNQMLEEEKQKYENENQDLKKSSEQLRMYLLKLKEELKARDTIISEKNNQIAVLTKKLALYSGEERNIKISKVMKEDIANLRSENRRLQKTVAELTKRLKEQKRVLQAKLASQKATITDLQKEREAELLHNSYEWEKKMRIMEAKYIKQIRMLEEENANLEQEFELKVEKVSEKLREKIAEDQQIRDKLNNVRQNQVDLLEEILLSKATMMQKVKPDFKKEQKDRAQACFSRAMNAILNKDYARAKYELEEVLLIDPNNQMTINMLGSINFLLKKEQ